MTGPDRIRAWRPGLPGVQEVLHATLVEHRYPMHAHDTWALLVVDRGAVRYDLDHVEHVFAHDVTPSVTLLPPHIPHNGHAASPGGFRKRVIYLDPGRIDTGLAGRAADAPALTDPGLRSTIEALHSAVDDDGTGLAAQSHLELVLDRLRGHLGDVTHEPHRHSSEAARRLLDLLEADDGIGLSAAAATLGFHPAHLVRSFTGEFGLAPHRYVVSRRVDRARRLILAGMPIGEAAVHSGFHDQPHLNRHFRKILGTSPGAFARSGQVRPSSASRTGGSSFSTA